MQPIIHFFESRFNLLILFWTFKIFEFRFYFWINSFKESNQIFWLNPKILKWILNLKSQKILNPTSPTSIFNPHLTSAASRSWFTDNSVDLWVIWMAIFRFALFFPRNLSKTHPFSLQILKFYTKITRPIHQANLTNFCYEQNHDLHHTGDADPHHSWVRELRQFKH